MGGVPDGAAGCARLSGATSQDRLLLLPRARVPLLPGHTPFALREGELFLRREHQAVPSGDREVQHAEDVVDGDAVHARAIGRVQEDRDERDRGETARDDRSGDPPLAPVRSLDVRQLLAEHDEGRHLHDVGDDRREDRHVQQRRHDLRAERLLLEDVHHVGDHVADDRSRDQRDVRRLARAVRLREELREVPGARQGVRVPPVGEDDREEARHQSDHEQQPEQLGGVPLAEDRVEPVQEREPRRAVQGGSARERRVEDERQDGRDQQRVHRPDRSLGDVATWVHRLLSRERHLLDREEEPDRER